MPSTPPDLPTPADPLVARLRADAVAVSGGGTLLVLGGAAVSLMLVALVLGLLWMIVGLPGLGFGGYFVALTALYAGGAVVWLRRRPNYFADVAFTYVDPTHEWLAPGTYAGATALAGPALDAMTLGPRMLMAGVHQGVDREPPSREHFFDRCALLLRQLARAGEAVPLPRVQIGVDETHGKLRPVLAYLNRHDWIGHSSAVDRLWLSSRAKADLPSLGVPMHASGESA